jgi:DNA-binding NtrC family response regulator
MIRILIVDDEPSVREGLAEWFAKEGWEIETAAEADEALRKLGAHSGQDAGSTAAGGSGAAATFYFDIALLDIRLPGMDGLELHRRIRERAPHLTVIFMTAYASVDTAVRAMKEGAYDYIVKPFEPDEFTELIRQALKDKLLVAAPPDTGDGIVAESRAMREIIPFIETIAGSDAPVILTGESGTGKELLARRIHDLGRRRFFPFVPVNCGAVSPTLLESELFGHEKGAFTGAQFRRKGRIELAAGGTLFLDEIGEIPAAMQIALLRVLETREIVRLGGEHTTAVDFRVLAATHRNLADDVRAGRFREDLFYRLNVLSIQIPPLRERPDDILPLAARFLAAVSAREEKAIQGFTDEASARLRAHTWPGNVRELRNVVERAALLCGAPRIGPDVLGIAPSPSGSAPGPEAAGTERLDDLERTHIRAVLEETEGNISRAAAKLGIDRTTLYRKIRRYGLPVTRVSRFGAEREPNG